jgi:hypothetical protein
LSWGEIDTGPLVGTTSSMAFSGTRKRTGPRRLTSSVSPIS